MCYKYHHNIDCRFRIDVKRRKIIYLKSMMLETRILHEQNCNKSLYTVSLLKKLFQKVKIIEGIIVTEDM